MTKINRMEMRGFKSFNHKTTLLLGNDFNCILGPNGSGKSNISDAISFVLGKGSAKAMRAEKSANLIYNGGKHKQGASSGEVSIYFDNVKREFPFEADEVRVTRVIKKNGQSAYKVNEKKVTRNQVLEVLSHAKINPDGYNIILQGDVIRFTEMPGEKRRQLIEEISGIGIYEEKKQKAVRELEKVDEQLRGADIILQEKKTQLRELRKDRDEALKFKELNDKLRHNKGAYVKIQLEKKEALHEELTKRKATVEEERKKHQEKEDTHKQELEEKKGRIEAIAHEVEQKGDKDTIDISKHVETLRVEVATKGDRINTLKNEIERIAQRKEQLEVSKKELADKVGSFSKEQTGIEKEKASKEKERNTIDEAITRFKEKHHLGKDVEDADQAITKIDEQAEQLQEDIQTLREEQQEKIREKDKFEFMISNLADKLKKVKEVEKEHEQEVKALQAQRKEFKQHSLQLTKALNEDGTIAAQINQTRIQIEQHQEQLGKLTVRQESAKEVSMQNAAVEAILKNKSKFKGVHGTIAQLGSVSSKYAVALEVAAGPRLQHIIVDNDATAQQCIAYLKQQQLGVATFLPLNKLKDVSVDQSLKKHDGVVDLAVNLVKFDTAYKKAFLHAVGNTAVVKDINTGRRVGIGKARMVTLEGDLLEATGAMRGGSRKQRKGIGFTEVELGKNISGLEETIGQLQSTLAAHLNKRKELEEEIQTLREKKAALEGEIIKKEKSLHLADDDLDSSKEQQAAFEKGIVEADKQLENIQQTLTDKNRSLAQLKIERQQLTQKIMQLRNPTVLAELNTLEDKRKELTEAILSLEAELKSSKTQVSSIFDPERENIDRILKQHDKEISDFKTEIASLQETWKTQKEELKEKEKEEAQFQKQFRKLFQERNKLSEHVNKIEGILEGVREHLRKADHKLNSIGLEEAALKAELAGLQEDFNQYKDLDIKIIQPEEVIKKEIAQAEHMRENMGNINMRALEVYEQVEAALHALLEKKEKLSQERNDVLGMMEEIEAKKRELFMNTYDVINKNFQNKFASLSRKGKAFLEIENQKDPFAGGVLIKVKLKGNKYMDLRSLSGGEKTMTTLAFIFAIQEHEPASFYILDEVDAALDKHNSEKLAQLVRSYCEKAQYVVISHNDAVISEADNLYGISMNEDGISKITTLKV